MKPIDINQLDINQLDIYKLIYLTIAEHTVFFSFHGTQQNRHHSGKQKKQDLPNFFN